MDRFTAPLIIDTIGKLYIAFLALDNGSETYFQVQWPGTSTTPGYTFTMFMDNETGNFVIAAKYRPHLPDYILASELRLSDKIQAHYS